ncbi:MAG: hypothetical protein PHW82_00720 [Bacteroidales bacterium]|nr:hypothetical protein [Bacteroidales bacterium]
MKKHLYLLIFLLPLLCCGTCNHEKVEGKIKMSTDEIMIGDTLELEAIIFDTEKKLKKIMWDVDLYEDASIISPIYVEGDSTEYKSLFIAKNSGIFKITLSCFYIQTNPTIIDEVEIKVSDRNN